LIQDPDQAFWEGARPKLGVTLGEAVVFSILGLLGDAERVLSTRRGRSLRDDEVNIRFSHPNWISENSVGALNCFRDAVAIALAIFAEGAPTRATVSHVRISAAELRNAVLRRKSIVGGLPSFRSQYSQ